MKQRPNNKRQPDDARTKGDPAPSGRLSDPDTSPEQDFLTSADVEALESALRRFRPRDARVTLATNDNIDTLVGTKTRQPTVVANRWLLCGTWLSGAIAGALFIWMQPDRVPTVLPDVVQSPSGNATDDGRGLTDVLPTPSRPAMADPLLAIETHWDPDGPLTARQLFIRVRDTGDSDARIPQPSHNVPAPTFRSTDTPVDSQPSFGVRPMKLRELLNSLEQTL